MQINDDLFPRRRSSSRHKFVVFDEVKISWFMNVISIRRESRPDGSVTSQGLDVPAVLQDWQLRRVILYVVIVIVDTTMIGRTCICSVTQQGRSQGSRSHTDACLRGCICEGPIGAALCITVSLCRIWLEKRRTINNLLSKFYRKIKDPFDYGFSISFSFSQKGNRFSEEMWEYKKKL